MEGFSQIPIVSLRADWLIGTKLSESPIEPAPFDSLPNGVPNAAQQLSSKLIKDEITALAFLVPALSSLPHPGNPKHSPLFRSGTPTHSGTPQPHRPPTPLGARAKDMVQGSLKILPRILFLSPNPIVMRYNI